VLLLTGPRIWAQEVPEPGDLGIFASPDRLETYLVATPFVPFDVYVVAFDPPGGMEGFEFAVQTSATFVVIQRELLVGESSIIIGDPDTNGWIVGLGGACIAGPKLALVREQLLPVRTGFTDELVCLGPSTPSSLPGLPNFYQCGQGLVSFGAFPSSSIYPDACLIVNPTLPCGPPAGQYLQIEDSVGQPGQTVRIPIGLDQRVQLKRCTIVPARIVGFSMELGWGAEAATFVAVDPGDLTSDWTVDVEPLAPARVRISATSPDPELDWIEDGQGESIAVVELLLSEDTGSTILQTAAETLTDAFTGTRAVEGAGALVTIQPISTRALSFGALKAQY
jgi:hypothetical protein